MKTTNLKSDKLLLNLFWKLLENASYGINSSQAPLELNLLDFRKSLNENKIMVSKQIMDIVKFIIKTYKSYDNQGDIIKVIQSPKTSNNELSVNLSHPKIIEIHSLLKELNNTSDSLVNNNNYLTLENLANKCKEQAKAGLNKSFSIGNIDLSKYYINFVLNFLGGERIGFTKDKIHEIQKLWLTNKSAESIVSKIKSYEFKHRFSTENSKGLKEETIKSVVKFFIKGYSEFGDNFFTNTARLLKHWSYDEIKVASKTFF
jgi:hypothetical protein